MFEQTFVNATANAHRGTPVALSLLLQMSVIGTALPIPLINPDLLPTAMMSNTLFLAPPAPPPPAAPPVTPAVLVRVARQVLNGALLMPTAIPERVAVIEEPPESPGGAGVAGSPGAGSGGSAGSATWGSLLNSLTDGAPPPPPPLAAAKDPERAKAPTRHRIGGNVQDALVVSRKIPDYPPMARAMRVEGTVVFQAVIGIAGTIQQLQLVSGHPMLVQAAIDAVRQWRYRPTLLNGDPLEVDTTISVSFTLRR